MAGILIVAAAFAAVVPANADLTALYDSVCSERGEPGSDFRPATSREVPDDGNLYVGPHEARYWVREGNRPARATLTRGQGHWGGVEEYCVVAVRDAVFEAAVATFSQRLDDRSMYGSNGALRAGSRWGTFYVPVSSHGASVVITRTADGWISLLTGGQVTPASSRWSS